MIVKKIKYFVKENGASPFEDWFNKLDYSIQAAAARIIQRVAKGGGKKSVKALKRGLFEIKMPQGPGYRVYFAKEDDLIILLYGGDKKNQSRDIGKAEKYWRSYVKQK